MNLVLDQAEEVNTKTGVKRPVGEAHFCLRSRDILFTINTVVHHQITDFFPATN
jgi:hypothetical protein